MDDRVRQRERGTSPRIDQKIVIPRRVLRFLGEGKTDPALGVGIDEEDFPPPLRERVAQVDGDGRLPDSSFLADQS